MRFAAGLLVVCALLVPGEVAAAPAGQMTWAVHGLGAVGNFPYSSPDEDLTLKMRRPG